MEYAKKILYFICWSNCFRPPIVSAPQFGQRSMLLAMIVSSLIWVNILNSRRKMTLLFFHFYNRYISSFVTLQHRFFPQLSHNFLILACHFNGMPISTNQPLLTLQNSVFESDFELEAPIEKKRFCQILHLYNSYRKYKCVMGYLWIFSNCAIAVVASALERW